MSNTTPPITKTARVLAAFMSGRDFNRFEAERELHDHCLHSTVSTLQQKHSITISRKFETVRGYKGNPTQVCRYWITLDERIRFENKRVNLRKQKAPTTTDQDKNKGFQMNRGDDTNRSNIPQTELNNGA